MTRKIARLVASAVAALLCAGCAAGPTASGGRPDRACFEPNDVRNFAVGPGNTLRIETFRNDVFVAKVASICPDLAQADRLTFTGARGLKICGRAGAGVAFDSPLRGPQHCRLGTIERASAATTQGGEAEKR
jgi:hypothetical protein